MKAYTDFVQSKKLAEFLPLESADMTWYKPILYDIFEPHTIPYSKNLMIRDDEKTPYWSLAALLSVLPSATLDTSDDHYCRVRCRERCTEWHDNPINACYEMILKLNEFKIL